MKTSCYRFVILIIVFVCCMGCTTNVPILKNSNGTLIVCGSPVAEECHVWVDKDTHVVEMPLVAIAEALGADVEWKTNYKANLIFDDTTYQLNIKKLDLRDINADKGNILRLSPGATGEIYTQAIDKEIILNNFAIAYFLQLRKMMLVIDYERAVVEITPNLKQPEPLL